MFCPHATAWFGRCSDGGLTAHNGTHQTALLGHLTPRGAFCDRLLPICVGLDLGQFGGGCHAQRTLFSVSGQCSSAGTG